MSMVRDDEYRVDEKIMALRRQEIKKKNTAYNFRPRIDLL
jgi:hypothetical protein